LLVSNQLKIPFKNLYKSKNTLGQDRLALVSAAAFNFPNENVLIVDVGSCITYDFKNNNNEYLGGGISPGISMRFKSLNTFTSNLPLIDFDNIHKLIGNNTKNSINSGVINGTISEINGIIQQYCEEFKNIRIILTGGDSNFLLKRIKNSIFADQNFLLVGLNKLLEDNS
jgi:type III pantothenate kinase